MKRLILSPDTLHAPSATISGENYHYLAHVLRLQPGDRIALLDGQGAQASGTVSHIDRDHLSLTIADYQKAIEARCSITVALAVPKGDRADWAVEKLTELGVNHIIFVHCARSVALPREGGNRQQRWQRLSEAAAKQAGIVQLPTLSGPISFSEVLQHPATVRWIADKCGQRPHSSELLPPSGDVIALIGPEGGFTDDELASAYDKGYTGLCLAPSILRIETAAIAAAALLVSAAS